MFPLFSGNATFHIGGFFNLYHHAIRGGQKVKEVSPQTGIMFSEAMRFALEKINNDSENVSSSLYGFKLKGHIKDATAFDELKEYIIRGYVLSSVHCAIGPFLSKDAGELAILSRSLLYPVVSYYASFDTNERPKKSFFFRTVPADTFRVFALLDIIQQLRWTYISIISSYHVNGGDMAKVFISRLREMNVSVSVHENLSEESNGTEYSEVINHVNRDKRVSGLVLFTTMDDSVGLLNALKMGNLTKRFQLLSAWGFSNYIEVTSGYEDVVEGAISIEYKTKEISEFRDYFLRLTPDVRQASYFKEFWQRTFNCTFPTSSNSKFPNCTGRERLHEGKGYYANTPVHLVIDAVYSMAKALQEQLKMECENQGSFCSARDAFKIVWKLSKHLRHYSFSDLTLNITSPFNSNSADLVSYDILNYMKIENWYRNIRVGTWSLKRNSLEQPADELLKTDFNRTFKIDIAEIKWKGNQSLVESVCAKECYPGERKVWSTECEKPSCWRCVKCPDNSILIENHCKDCGLWSRPDNTFSFCREQQIEYVDIHHKRSQALLTFASLGFLIALAFTVVFVKNNDHRIVRASGRDLCYFILAGIYLSFVIPAVCLVRPTALSCTLQQVFPGLALCICYAPFFLKTLRIYRIFHHASQSASAPQLVSPASQVLIVTGVILMQVVIGIVYAVNVWPLEPPTVKLSGHVILHCGRSPFPMMLNLIPSVFFMLGCTWFAFKTRKFPKNFNEAKYICRTMYVTCVVWSVFLPAYIITHRQQEKDFIFARTYLTMGFTIFTAYVALLGLFGQKVKLLLFPEPEQKGSSSSFAPTSSIKSVRPSLKKARLSPGGESDGTVTPHRVEFLNGSFTSDVSDFSSSSPTNWVEALQVNRI